MLAAACAISILTAASAATLALIRHQGIGIGGDEPFYLVEAVAIGRYHTLNMNPGFNFAVIHHAIRPWKAHPGPHLATTIGQWHQASHGLYLSAHGIGLSALLAIPMLVGTRFAEVTLASLLAVLAVGLVYLIGEVGGMRSPWRFVLVGLFLAPAYVLGTTQVYPDLISGLIIAIVIMLVGLLELRGRWTGPQLITGACLLAFLPWFDQKNILLTLLLLAVVLASSARRILPRGQIGWLVIPATISLAFLLALNVWGFGHPLGSTQHVSLVSGETATRAVALLFDRRQGMFAQLPPALLGLAGLWILRRRMPIGVVSALLIVSATIYGNATQVISFGGGSFIGRFGWPALPVVLAFACLYLLELWKVRHRAAAFIAAALGCLYALQALPFLRDEHIYSNHFAWDPASYTGWWGGLDPSPILGYIGGMEVSAVVRVATNSPIGISGELWSTSRGGICATCGACSVSS